MWVKSFLPQVVCRRDISSQQWKWNLPPFTSTPASLCELPALADFHNQVLLFPLKTLSILSNDIGVVCSSNVCVNNQDTGSYFREERKSWFPFCDVYKTIKTPTASKTEWYWAFLWKPTQPASPFQFWAVGGSHTHCAFSPSLMTDFLESVILFVLASCASLSREVLPNRSLLTFSNFPNTLSDLWANYLCTSDVLLMLIYLHCG